MEQLDVVQGSPKSDKIIDKPIFLEKMLKLSELLSKDMPHVRIDWYYANNRLYFGEIIFFDGSGFCVFEREEWDYKLGEWIQIENCKEITR